MPEMRRMGEVYRDVLTVISITQDGETSWKKYSAEQGIEGVNLRDPESLTGLSVYYGVKGIPHYVLISTEGKVITSWTGYAAGQLEKKLDELLPDSVGRPFVIEGNLQGVEDGLGIGLGRVEPGGIPNRTGYDPGRKISLQRFAEWADAHGADGRSPAGIFIYTARFLGRAGADDRCR